MLAPHPDDETLTGGGTAALLAREGATVEVLAVTDGEATHVDRPRRELRELRRDEMRAACRILGLGEPSFLGLPDGEVAAHLHALTAAIQARLDRGCELVLLPWHGDDHADHRAVGRALAACRADPDLPVWGGEVWTPLPATRLVDVTGAADELARAVRAHRTAHEAFDLDALLALKRYRSVHGLRGRGHAEAFLVLPFGDYADAVAGSSAPQIGAPT